jgi:hypothetical protein
LCLRAYAEGSSKLVWFGGSYGSVAGGQSLGGVSRVGQNLAGSKSRLGFRPGPPWKGSCAIRVCAEAAAGDKRRIIKTSRLARVNKVRAVLIVWGLVHKAAKGRGAAGVQGGQGCAGSCCAGGWASAGAAGRPGLGLGSRALLAWLGGREGRGLGVQLRLPSWLGWRLSWVRWRVQGWGRAGGLADDSSGLSQGCG